MRPRPINGVVGKARDDVPVDVIDRLTRNLAVVNDDIQPVGPGGRADGAAKPRQKRAGRCGNRVREVSQMSVMRLGHDQRVAAIHRINIEEGDGFGRFEYLCGRDSAGDDLAEDAIGIVGLLMAHDGLRLDRPPPLPSPKRGADYKSFRNSDLLLIARP